MVLLYAALLTPALAGDVLWYTGNDGYAEAVITTLTTTTAALGSAGIDSTDVWPGSFAGYTLVFLVIPTADFTPAQSADLVTFVADGGTLVLISDNNAYTPHTASVFNTLGPDLGLETTFVEDALDRSCGHYATVAATHALTDRLSSGGTTYAKSGDMILSDAATELLTGESGQPLLAIEAGVVLSTDIELLVDSCGLSVDNAQLIENLYYGVCAATDDDDDGDGSYDPYCGGDDCDDTDPTRAGGAAEACDGVDNDCDEVVPADEVDADGDGLLACAECDDADPRVPDGITWYRDADGDGFGTGADTVYVCTMPDGYVDNAQDCDDADPYIGPGQPESCDGRDQDCDGQADEGALDATLWYQDADGDGYGGALATAACTAPEGTVGNGDDCDDASARIAPGADEYCNGLDDDCDGAADEDGVNADTWYADADGDGYGDGATPRLACDAPEGFVSDSRDCDDSDANIYPGAPGWTVTCAALDTGDPPKTSTPGCGCQSAPPSAAGWLGLGLALGATRRRSVSPRSGAVALALLALVACNRPRATEDWTRDILSTRLAVDLSDRSAEATVEVAAKDDESGLSLEAQGLTVDEIRLADGGKLDWSQDATDGRLDIGLPKGADTVVITYTFPERGYTFDGYMSSGDTFLWPDYCGNLYPCHSDPADGLRFSVDVTGLGADETVVTPQDLLPMDAPSYMLGFSVGSYTRRELGTTTAGTSVVFYATPDDDAADVDAGVASFLRYVDTLEGLFGPYPFGPEVGAKSVRWCEEGNCEYAGMEEHPYFDVSDGSVYDPTVYAHEAAHAWFGDGVRLGCWGEDLVMSEGSASYLEVALLALVDGDAAAQADIDYYKQWLAESRAAGDDQVVWPDTCDAVNTYDLWYDVTYSRGALYWLDVEEQVGREALLGAFADFAAAHLGEAASMGDLLDAVEASTGFDPYPLAEIWLRSTELPEGYVLPEVEARPAARAPR